MSTKYKVQHVPVQQEGGEFEKHVACLAQTGERYEYCEDLTEES